MSLCVVCFTYDHHGIEIDLEVHGSLIRGEPATAFMEGSKDIFYPEQCWHNGINQTKYLSEGDWHSIQQKATREWIWQHDNAK
jgi:hypothetical protein